MKQTQSKRRCARMLAKIRTQATHIEKLEAAIHHAGLTVRRVPQARRSAFDRMVAMAR